MIIFVKCCRYILRALNPSSITSIGEAKYHSSFSVPVPVVSSSNILLYESYVKKGLIGESICNDTMIEQYQNYTQYT